MLTENSDVLTAARAQGWRVERTKRHIRLVPADKTRPAVVGAATPSDRRARRNFIADLRRSGLIWPWPATSGTQKAR
jgi:hypothetical protein